MKKELTSPFKFLDPYEKGDYDFFFGRDKEEDLLFQAVNKNRLVLVYGQSGTGKTSLIKCGLANRFESTDWLPFFIRRGQNIMDSICHTLSMSKALGGISISKNIEDIVENLYKINKRYVRPIYLIFDQFEEFFLIEEKDQEEKKLFKQLIKRILQDEKTQSVHIIFSLREEFFALLDFFDDEIPNFTDRRIRIEPMRSETLKEVIFDTCNYFNVTLESDEDSAKKMVEQLKTKGGIALPYIQIYLDVFWKEDFDRDYKTKIYPDDWEVGTYPELIFTNEEIESFGSVEEALEKYLLIQTKNLEAEIKSDYTYDSEDIAQIILDGFITKDVTKQPIYFQITNDQIHLKEDAPVFLLEIPKEILHYSLVDLEQKRLIRRKEDSFELSHDILAPLIDKQRTEEQQVKKELFIRIENKYKEWINSEKKDYFPVETLDDIESKLTRLKIKSRLPQSQLNFLQQNETYLIEQKKKEKEKQEAKIRLLQGKVEAEKSKLRFERIRNFLVAFSLIVIGIAYYFFGESVTSKEKAIYTQQELDNRIEIDKQKTELTNQSAIAYKAATFDRTIAFNLIGEVVEQDHSPDIARQLYNKLINESGLKPFYKHTINIGSNSNFVSNIETVNINNKLVVVGTTDLSMKLSIWDEKGQLVRQKKSPYPIQDFHIDKEHKKIIACSQKGAIIIWNLNNEEELPIYTKPNLPRITDYAYNFPYLYTVGHQVKDTLDEVVHTYKIDDINGNINIEKTPLSHITLNGQLYNGHKFNNIRYDSNRLEYILYEQFQDSFYIEKYLDTVPGTWVELNQNIRQLEVIPDTERFLVGINEGNVYMYEFQNDRAVHIKTFKHTKAINSIKVNADRETILMGGNGKTAKLWSFSGFLLKEFAGHSDALEDVDIIDDFQFVITSSQDGSIKYWDYNPIDIPIIPFKYGKQVKEVAFLDANKFVIGGIKQNLLPIYDINNYSSPVDSLTLNTNTNITSIKTNTNGYTIVSCEDLNTFIWNPNGKRFTGGTNNKLPSAVSVSDDPIYFIEGGISNGKGKAAMITINSLNKKEKFKRQPIPWDFESKILSVDINSVSNKIVVGEKNGTITVININGFLSDTITLNFKSDKVSALSISPDGQKLLIGDWNNKVILYDLNADSLIHTFEWHNSDINKVLFSPDGTKILTVAGNIGRLWNASSPYKEQICPIYHSETIFGAAFSFDGRYIATGGRDNIVKIWEIEKFKDIASSSMDFDERLEYKEEVLKKIGIYQINTTK